MRVQFEPFSLPLATLAGVLGEGFFYARAARHKKRLPRRTRRLPARMRTTPSRFKAQIMDAPGLNRTLARLANEIIESNRGIDKLVFVGIRTRGVEVAQRLIEKIEQFEGRKLPLGALDVTLYRDDLSYNQRGSLHRMKKSRVQATDIPFDLDGKIVILVDDVLYTGRTIRAALDALMDFGRPAKIRLAVIIDRGHRELPVRADFTGKEIMTTPGEEVRVKLANVDGVDGVDLVEVLEERPT